MLKVGQRASYQGELCTIRYVGEIPPWKGVTAYGVEWDNPERGKHSGELDGLRYFTTVVPSAGSFVKSTKKRDTTRSFEEALHEKYSPGAQDDETIRVSRSKTVQWVGFDKTRLIQEQFDQLPIVSLPRLAIDHGKAETALNSLKTLDLGLNLFDALSVIYDICKDLKVESLSLAGNRFASIHTPGPLPTINDLNLSTTLLGNPNDIASIFPNLKSLNLSGNRLTQVDVSAFVGLTSLDLSFNELTDLPFLPSNITKLHISNNNIKTIETCLSQLVELNLSYNNISDWKYVDFIGDDFSALRALRINGNPITSMNENTASTDSYVIGRCEAITKLNGIEVSDRERLDAELYFMSKVAANDVPSPSARRWKHLCDLHGAPAQVQEATPVSISKNKVLTINFVYNGDTKQIKVLRSLTVQKLKSLVAKQFKLRPLDIELHTSENIELVEPLRSLDFYNLSADDTLTVS